MIPINTVIGGDDVERAVMYKPPSRELYNYLQDNFHNAMSYVKDIGTGFVNNLSTLYNKYTSLDSIHRTKETLLNHGVHFSQDVICNLDYTMLNQANLMMQRFIMAHPKVGDLYERGMLYGYQDTFFDREPDTYGSDRIDYGRAMDGILQFDSEGQGFIEHIIQDDSIYNEIELSESDQFTIASVYDYVTLALANGLDPTDPNNSMTES